MEKTIEISKSLWIYIESDIPEHDDGLINLRDDTGGDTLIDREEIPALIEVLKGLQKERQDDAC